MPEADESFTEHLRLHDLEQRASDSATSMVGWYTVPSGSAVTVAFLPADGDVSTQGIPYFSYQASQSAASREMNPSVRLARILVRYESELSASFIADPVEDGVHHPAESILNRILKALDDGETSRWLDRIVTGASNPAFSASLLRCLGRLPEPISPSWRIDLLERVLAQPDVEMRDAAVQAAEWWADDGIVAILKEHHEPEPWLAEYIRDVIEDLSG